MYWSRYFQIIGFGFFFKKKSIFPKWSMSHLLVPLLILQIPLVMWINCVEECQLHYEIILGKTSYHMMWLISFIYHNTCYILFLWIIRMFIGLGLSTIPHYYWQSTVEKKFEYVEIKFHSNANIESHCM